MRWVGAGRAARVSLAGVASTASLAASLLFGACRTAKAPAPAPRPALGRIELRESPAAEGAPSPPLDADALAGVARRLLLGSGLLDGEVGNAADSGVREGGATAGKGVVRARIVAGTEITEVEKKGVVRAGVRVRLDTRPSDSPGAIDEDLSAGGERIYEIGPQTDRRELGQRLVERTLTDLLTGFLARARLVSASENEIHALITGQGAAGGSSGRGESSPLREEAIRVAGARGMRDEIPALLPMLGDDDEAVRDAALGALIAMHEQRAVTELTRNRSLRDRHEMRKILDAIAILGGSEARDYLSFVAESHDDEEIRKLAAEAKSRLERRREK